jgi:hypothetical protein
LGLGLPYNAGSYFTSGCTKLIIDRLSNYNGGVQLSISAFQVQGCWQQYATKFKIKPRTNSSTEYVFYSNGNLARVTGTTGGISSLSKDTTAFALSSGSATIENIKGAKAPIVAGQMAIASPSGIKVSAAPSSTFRVAGDRIITDPTNKVFIDGVETRNFEPAIPHEVTIETLSNTTTTVRLRQWPKGVFNQINRQK